MTAQIRDRLIYHDDTFGILRVSGDGLFNPADYGIKTVFISSGCGRGFHCNYEIIDNSLQLQEAYLALEYLERKRIELGKGIRLFGKVPSSPHKYAQEYVCKGLEQSIKFTGGILIGNNFIRELLRPWYIPSIYKFRTVYELIFESGQLIKATNYSQQISELSNRLIGQEIDISETEAIRQWSRDYFKFDYY